MRPDAVQVLAFAGSRRPATYLEILNKVLKDHAAGTLTPDKLAPYGSPQQAESAPLAQLRAQIRELQDSVFADKKSGVFESAEALRHLLLHSHLYGDPNALIMAKNTLDGLLQQVDSAWGGMFYASKGNWANTATEKRLESQAAALQAYADGYQLTKNKNYREAITDIERYLSTFMRSQHGTFFANQQDRLDNLPSDMGMDDYYALNDKQRRRYGIPTIDHAVYSDVNARVILGYVMAYEATGREDYLATATQAANYLLDKRQTPAGWIIQFTNDAELAPTNACTS